MSYAEKVRRLGRLLYLTHVRLERPFTPDLTFGERRLLRACFA